MYLINKYLMSKVMQLFNSVDAMIDNMSLLHFSLVVDADFDALGISEALTSLDA
jgi:hypothetical protein